MTKSLTDLLIWLEPLLCTVVLAMMLRSHQFRAYRYVAALLVTRIFVTATAVTLLKHSAWLGVTPHHAYQTYFAIYWPCYAVEAVFGFGVIISIYQLAMEPLKGLKTLGMIMFRWAGAISVAIAITIALSPRISSTSFIVRSVSQLQQTQSILTLCMLLFVCFAIHPMGLSYKSRIFGISLGLGLMATVDLIEAAWIPQSMAVASLYSIISNITICCTLAIWATYFALPEPARRMIILPTTSPFLRWNQISEVLGDEPGFVAVGEVTLDMFAPAELEVMRRASGKMGAGVQV